MPGCPQVYVQLICVFREFLLYVYYLFIGEPWLLYLLQHVLLPLLSAVASLVYVHKNEYACRSGALG